MNVYGGFCFVISVLYSTLLYLPPLRFHCVGECWDQCGGSGMFIPDPGSDFFTSWIPDPNCLHPGSRILIKEFKSILTPKKAKKWFLSSKK
jgi:hypothetical protein